MALYRAVTTVNTTAEGNGALTLASIVSYPNELILISLLFNSDNIEISGLTLNGAPILSQTFTTGSFTARLYYMQSGGGTESLVATVANFVDVAIVGAAISTAKPDITYSNPSIVTSVVAAGSSTTPSSGALAATTLPNALLYSTIFTQGPIADNTGTWNNSFTAGQRSAVDTQWVISEGYKSVEAVEAYTGSKTDITSRPWIAMLSAVQMRDWSPTVSVAQAGPELHETPHFVSPNTKSPVYWQKYIAPWAPKGRK